MTTFQSLEWAWRISDEARFFEDLEGSTPDRWEEWVGKSDEFIEMTRRALAVAQEDGRGESVELLQNTIAQAEAIGDRIFAWGVAKGYHL
jgi:hypothetical protein